MAKRLDPDLDVSWQAYLNDYHAVVALIEAGADIELKDRDGRTPLINAVSVDYYLPLIEYLLEKGANINAQDKAGWSALHFCAQDNKIELAEFLIKNGATVDIKDQYGATPLMNAATTCYELMVKNDPNPGAMIQFLQKNGADKNIKNKEGVTFFDVLKIYDRDIRQYFI
jgi:Ankyrin repeats (many copies)